MFGLQDTQDLLARISPTLRKRIVDEDPADTIKATEPRIAQPAPPDLPSRPDVVTIPRIGQAENVTPRAANPTFERIAQLAAAPRSETYTDVTPRIAQPDADLPVRPNAIALPRIAASTPTADRIATVDSPSSPVALTPGGQNFQRIAMNSAPAVDTTYHGAPAAFSNPDTPLPNTPDRINLPRGLTPRSASAIESAQMYKDYGPGGPNESNLASIEAANLANHGRGPQREKGAMHWLKDMGRSALRGFIHGGLGGALGGAIRGGIDPQFANEAEYYEKTLPNSRAAANDERIAKQSSFNRIDDIGKITGLTPGGNETEGAADRRIRQEGVADQRATNEELRRQGIDDREGGRREAAAKNHVEVARQLGRPVDPAMVKGTSMEPFGGVTPSKAGGKGTRATHRGVGGTVDESGTFHPDKDESGKPLPYKEDKTGFTPIQQYRIGKDNEKAAADLQNKDDSRREKVLGKGGMKDHFEEIKKKLSNAANEAGAMDSAIGKGATYGEGHPQKGQPIPGAGVYKGEIITKDKADEKRQEAAALRTQLQGLADTLRQEYGGIVDVGDDGTWVRPKPRATQSAPRAAAAPAPSGRISSSPGAGKVTPDAVKARARADIEAADPARRAAMITSFEKYFGKF